ncbi:choice-of-anchor U domain-containing protein [Halioglobus maricola]|uniref:choice-of-anchor U domain-containing protein n=1 Tax=Halioglobus maricola TaxID=2601894 RepID=UPI003B8473B7
MTEIGQSDVTITAIPSNPNSECTLVREGFNPSIEMAAPGKAIAENALTFGVNFELAGCYISGETIQIIIDFGTELPPGAAAYKVIGDSWAAIPGAIVRESKISYSISDNDGFLDQDPAIGRISDPVSVAVPAAAAPVRSATVPNAIPALPSHILMALTVLMALWGAANLVQTRRRASSL